MHSERQADGVFPLPSCRSESDGAFHQVWNVVSDEEFEKEGAQGRGVGRAGYYE